jgi:hypothetical protein
LLACLFACLLVLLRLLSCVFLRSLLNIIVSSFGCQLIWLSHARARVKLKELYSLDLQIASAVESRTS